MSSKIHQAYKDALSDRFPTLLAETSEQLRRPHRTYIRSLAIVTFAVAGLSITIALFPLRESVKTSSRVETIDEDLSNLTAVVSGLVSSAEVPIPGLRVDAPKGEKIVEVTSMNVNLRSGPGPEHGPVMSVTRGARLVVETEHGDWLRVIGPTGERLWVAAQFTRPYVAER